LKINLRKSAILTKLRLSAELQAVLNTFTEHDLQDAFIKGRTAAKRVYTSKGTTSSEIVASMIKVSFWQGGSTSPGNYGWLLYFPINANQLPLLSGYVRNTDYTHSETARAHLHKTSPLPTQRFN
jgi:hypothetical protein